MNNLVTKFYILFVTVWKLSMPCVAQGQDHGHLNVGAASHQQGAKLIFENGEDFLPSSGYVKTLVYTNQGRFAGKYQGNITLTALHSVDPFGEIVPNSPAPGSFVTVQIVSVEGPAGGAFEFWEAGTTIPTLTVSAGTMDAEHSIEISDSSLGAGHPGADPYGHIHGRRFTATEPGIYTVGFLAHDRSTNGENNGPIHQSSDLFFIRFQAGFNLLEAKLNHETKAEISFVAGGGLVWQLESTDTLNGGTWEPVGEPVMGTDKVTTQVDQRPLTQSRIYRLKGVQPPP